MSQATTIDTAVLLCRCLRIAADDVREAILIHGLETVQEVRKNTKAGTGCMACHCKIRQLLLEHVAKKDYNSVE